MTECKKSNESTTLKQKLKAIKKSHLVILIISIIFLLVASIDYVGFRSPHKKFLGDWQVIDNNSYYTIMHFHKKGKIYREVHRFKSTTGDYLGGVEITDKEWGTYYIQGKTISITLDHSKDIYKFKFDDSYIDRTTVTLSQSTENKIKLLSYKRWSSLLEYIGF